MWVIKLGGSLIGSNELQAWLDVIANKGDGKVIIVPGGGLFADTVRQAQSLTQVNDATAHRMAVMAMDQFGVMMTGLNPKLVTADCELELAERGWQHLGIVWLASRMVNAADDIATNWDITSDSLAAWLAHKVEASHLLIVKSAQVTTGQASAHGLIKLGMLDPSFDQVIQQKNNKPRYKTWMLNKSQHVLFNSGFDEAQLEAHALEILDEELQ